MRHLTLEIAGTREALLDTQTGGKKARFPISGISVVDLESNEALAVVQTASFESV
jgi:hypothetical protein